MESTHTFKLKTSPNAGVYYPHNYAEFMAWVPDDVACVDYLDWLRWKGGFDCPTCHASKGLRMKNGNPRPKQFVAPPIRINKFPASLDISVPSHTWRMALP